MHELSTAQSILSTALRVATQNRAEKVVEIVLEINALSYLNRDQLTFCLKLLSENTMAEGARIRITERDVKSSCNECGFNGSVKMGSGDHFEALASMRCPRCDSGDIKVEGQTDCVLKKIRVKG